MEDRTLQLLTEEELEIHRRFERCSTIEEIRQLEEDIDMSIEEFKEKYGLIDIKDLKGKYGF